jgi:hypothetical protein
MVNVVNGKSSYLYRSSFKHLGGKIYGLEGLGGK